MINKVAENILQWMCRDFENTEFWKEEARRVFLSTAKSVGQNTPKNQFESWQCDSELSRQKLAKVIQVYFSGIPRGDVSYKKWNKDFTAVEEHKASYPEITKSVNWHKIADYFLLAACTPWNEMDTLNETRREINKKIKRRVQSNNERISIHIKFLAKFYELAAESFGKQNIDKITNKIRKEHFQTKKGNVSDRTVKLTSFDQFVLIENDNEEKTLSIPELQTYQPKYY